MLAGSHSPGKGFSPMEGDVVRDVARGTGVRGRDDGRGGAARVGDARGEAPGAEVPKGCDEGA